MKLSKNNQKGFTLIELIMVIVILGILSAFALPRFADFGDNASLASIEGARGAVQSASGIVRSSALANRTADDGTVTIEGSEVQLAGGYAVARDTTNDDITDAAQLSSDYIVTDRSAAYVTGVIIVSLGSDDNDRCFVYEDADNGGQPVISVIGFFDSTTGEEDCVTEEDGSTSLIEADAD